MQYYIHNKEKDYWYVCDDWWELVGTFYSENKHYYHKLIDDIAHNENDGYYDTDLYYHWNEKHQRDMWYTEYTWKKHIYIVYDEYDRIINKADIQNAFKIYNPDIKTGVKKKEKKKHHTYRNNKSWSGFRNNIHRNKRYVAELMGCKGLFPSDSSATDAFYFVRTWSDDFPNRSTHRNWKYHSKKRKQWM